MTRSILILVAGRGWILEINNDMPQQFASRLCTGLFVWYSNNLTLAVSIGRIECINFHEFSWCRKLVPNRRVTEFKKALLTQAFLIIFEIWPFSSCLACFDRVVHNDDMIVLCCCVTIIRYLKVNCQIIYNTFISARIEKNRREAGERPNIYILISSKDLRTSQTQTVREGDQQEIIS